MGPVSRYLFNGFLTSTPLDVLDSSRLIMVVVEMELAGLSDSAINGISKQHTRTPQKVLHWLWSHT